MILKCFLRHHIGFVAFLATFTFHARAILIPETISGGCYMNKERNFWKIGFFIVSGVLCIFLLTSMKMFYSSGDEGIIDVLKDIGSALESIDRTLDSIKFHLM